MFIPQAYPPGGLIFTGIGVLLSIRISIDLLFLGYYCDILLRL